MNCYVFLLIFRKKHRKKTKNRNRESEWPKKNERFITIFIVVRRKNVILVRNVQTFAKAKSWYPVDAASRDNVTRQLTVKKRGGGIYLKLE